MKNGYREASKAKGYAVDELYIAESNVLGCMSL